MSNPQQPEIRRSDESPTTKQRTEDAHPTTAPGGSHDKTDSQPTPRESSFAVPAVRAQPPTATEPGADRRPSRWRVSAWPGSLVPVRCRLALAAVSGVALGFLRAAAAGAMQSVDPVGLRANRVVVGSSEG
jgi:hypothetical protein